jgi:hypothetical protein
VEPRVDVDDVEKRKFLTPPGLELRPLGRPARSQSLYRLGVNFIQELNHANIDLILYCIQCRSWCHIL